MVPNEQKPFYEKRDKRFNNHGVVIRDPDGKNMASTSREQGGLHRIIAEAKNAADSLRNAEFWETLRDLADPVGFLVIDPYREPGSACATSYEEIGSAHDGDIMWLNAVPKDNVQNREPGNQRTVEELGATDDDEITWLIAWPDGNTVSTPQMPFGIFQ